MEVLLNTAPNKAQEDVFKFLSKQISMLLATENIRIKAYQDGLPYFSKLSETHQIQVNNQLSFYAELCSEHIKEGYKISDGSTFLWRAFRKLGLTPTSDLFQFLTNESVIEVYSDENIQLFRNLNFFTYCSYSLEELHSLEWWHLYDRDAGVTNAIFEEGRKMFGGEIRGTYCPGLPDHIVRELASEEKLVMQVEFQAMSPLFSNRRPTAALLATKPKIISN